MRRSFLVGLGGVVMTLGAGAAGGCSAPSAEASGTTANALDQGCELRRGVKVCNDFLTTFRRYHGPYPKVGEPLTPSFDHAGDTFQVFERVVMNLSPGARCDSQEACVALTGIDDAVETLGRPYHGDRSNVSCDDSDLAPRDAGCLQGSLPDNPAADDVRAEISNNLSYYGLLISNVMPTCDWWDNGRHLQHTKCFWTQRGKVGRNDSGIWEYEALGWKRYVNGAIAGAPTASGGNGAANPSAGRGVNLRFAAFIPAPCEGVEYFGMFNTNNRLFSYADAITNSKVAIDVNVDFANPAGSAVRKLVGESIRYKVDGDWPKVPGQPDWCRSKPASPPIEYRATESDKGITASVGSVVGGKQSTFLHLNAHNAAAPTPDFVTPPIDAWCSVDVTYEYRAGANRPASLAFDCKHKKMPSYELYVDGDSVFTHSVTDTGGGPQDLLFDAGIHKVGTCANTNGGWVCSCVHPKDHAVAVRCDAPLTD